MVLCPPQVALWELGSERRGAERGDLHDASRIPLSILNLPRFSRSLPFTSVTSIIHQCVWLPPVSFYICMCMLSHFGHVRLCDPMDRSPLAPLCMGFSRQEYWSGLPCPPPGDLPDPGAEPRSPSLHRAARTHCCVRTTAGHFFLSFTPNVSAWDQPQLWDLPVALTAVVMPPWTLHSLYCTEQQSARQGVKGTG